MKFLALILIVMSVLASSAHATDREKSTKESSGGNSVGNGSR